MTLDISRKLHAVEVGNGLEAGELRRGKTHGTDVLSVFEVKLWVVKLFASFKLGRILLLRIVEIELNCEWVITDLISIALLYVP